MPEIDSSLANIDYGDLAVLAASALNDTAYATWSLAQLKEWVLQATEEYSNHFQYFTQNLITCTTGVTEYNLATDVYQIVRVEHPTGRTPPAYLAFFYHGRPDFSDRDDRYDAYINGIQTEAKIWISRTPATGEYIHVLYSRFLWTPSGGSYIIRVRQAHYPILIQYVVWRAYHERWQAALTESLTLSHQDVIDPAIPGVTKTVYDFATDRAQRWHEATELARKTYEDMLATAKAQVGRSDCVRWQMDDHDPVY